MSPTGSTLATAQTINTGSYFKGCKMTYTVKHYNTQGLTESACGLSKAEARIELNRFVSDEAGTGNCSKAFNAAGKCIAFRHWDKKRISWMVTPSKAKRQALELVIETTK